MRVALDIALSGMQAAQYGIDIASHNVANANVEGYSRQRVQLKSRALFGDSASLKSGGVDVATVERVADHFVARHIREQLSEKSYFDKLGTRLGELEAVLNETDDTGLGRALNEFFTNLSRLADDPESQGVRITTLNAAQLLTGQVRSVHDQIESIDHEVRLEINQQTDRANLLLDRVALLNSRIAGGLHTERNVSDLMDERDRTLEELSNLLPAQINVSNDGMFASVSVNGFALVMDVDSRHLETTSSGVFIEGTTDQVTVNGGSLGALLEMRDNVLPRYMADVDTLAASIIGQFNAQHAAGQGLDGTTGDALFTGTDAGDIAVNAALLADPRRLAASADGAPGNADNARLLHELRKATNTAGVTFDEYHQAIIGGIGGEVSSANNQAEGLDSLLDQLITRRESIIGVSLDEEMVNLVRFQQAYTASSRIISIVDELTQTLLQLGR